MAENDAHYNKTLDEIDPQSTDDSSPGEYAESTSLPEAGEAAMVYAEAANTNDEGRSNMPVISFPPPGNNGFACTGNGTCPGGNSSDSMSTWWPAFPTFPSMPSLPSMSPQAFGQVRFLNASTNAFTVNISIDNTIYALNSRFGTISNYDRVTDGFHTVTVRRSSGMRSILLQQSFPFAAGQRVTMVLTDSASGGLEMIRVIDTGCSNLPAGSGCYRFANMSYSGSRFDLLYGNETIFRNVGYQRVSSYKQAVAGTYPFTVANSNAFNAIRELPIIVIGAIGTSIASRTPVINFTASISPGRNYTSYLIGNTWSSNNLQVLTVSDN